MLVKAANRAKQLIVWTPKLAATQTWFDCRNGSFLANILKKYYTLYLPMFNSCMILLHPYPQGSYTGM